MQLSNMLCASIPLHFQDPSLLSVNGSLLVYLQEGKIVWSKLLLCRCAECISIFIAIIVIFNGLLYYHYYPNMFTIIDNTQSTDYYKLYLLIQYSNLLVTDVFTDTLLPHMLLLLQILHACNRGEES